MLSRTGKTVLMTLRAVIASRRPQPLHRLGDITMRTITTFLACFFVVAAVAAGCSSEDSSDDSSNDSSNDSSRLEEICKGLCSCEGGCKNSDYEDCQAVVGQFDVAGCEDAFNVFYKCAIGYSCDCSAEEQSLGNCVDNL
jgi:hypothetical protein